jgi:hypothetical protein
MLLREIVEYLSTPEHPAIKRIPDECRVNNRWNAAAQAERFNGLSSESSPLP